jgi:hypothetical protein
MEPKVLLSRWQEHATALCSEGHEANVLFITSFFKINFTRNIIY